MFKAGLKVAGRAAHCLFPFNDVDERAACNTAGGKRSPGSPSISASAALVSAPPKEHVTLRLDVDVLKWFRSQGKGYQTQINTLLRAYMEARRSK